MKNLTTTLFGCLTAVGIILADQSGHNLHLVGICMAAVGGVGTGAAAKDAANKTT